MTANINYAFLSNTFLNRYVDGGANLVYEIIDKVSLGNSTVNVSINTTSISLSNSSINFVLRAPNTSQHTSGSYYLNANGSWSVITANGGGGVSEVQTGNGLTGGPITTTGTISVLSNTGIISNASGLYVNSAYINTLDAASVGGNTAATLRTYTDNKSGNAYSNAVSIAASDATTKAGTSYTNAVSYVDGKSYVNSSQLSANLGLYQTFAGLASNVATLTSNNSSFVGGNSAANLIAYSTAAYTNAVAYVDSKPFVNTTQLSGNLALYQTTAGLSANVLTITSNNANYIKANTGLVSNATGVYVNSAYIATIASNSATYANSSISNTFTIGNANYFNSSGNVGICVSTPERRLHVARLGTSGGTYPATDASTTAIFSAGPGANSSSSIISFLTGNTAIGGMYFGDTESSTIGRITYSHTDNALNFWTNSGQRMLINSSGNVGIGNTAPTDKLSVNGTTYLQANVTLNAGLLANGSLGSAGQVLTSNGSSTYWSAVSANGASAEPYAFTHGSLSSATYTSSNTNLQTLDQIVLATHRSAKYEVSITSGSAYQKSTLSIIHNGTTSYITESDIINTDSPLANFSTTITGANVIIQTTPINAVTVYKMIKTVINV
jgi:hypothetical protein